ncbi:MAG: tRNA (adenosine(37)-N6)-dimethylallyltransferase MiaA [Minisyncoccia bacterium]
MVHKTLLVIVGPTASGKSAYAVKLAKKLGGEVISADSRQVYKGLDIGTGKITKKEMRRVPHHLLDIASPKKVFTASEYREQGRAVLGDIISRGKVPILCGGTGFYIDVLVGRIEMPDVPPNPVLRAKLEKKSAHELHAILKKMDPRRAQNIDAQNPVRLVRAIEIAKALGRVPRPKPKLLPYHLEWIGLRPDEKTLQRKIHTRLLARMKQGMVLEAKKLHKSGVSYKRMHALGLEYRYLALLLRKKITKKEFVVQLESAIWQYSKSQMKYWKRNKEIRWVRPVARV